MKFIDYARRAWRAGQAAERVTIETPSVTYDPKVEAIFFHALPRAVLRARLEHNRAERETRRACCMRRARARRRAFMYTYIMVGSIFGLALGMLLGAASKVCQ